MRRFIFRLSMAALAALMAVSLWKYPPGNDGTAERLLKASGPGALAGLPH